MLTPLVINLALILALMTLLWLLSLPLRDVSIVDIFWGMGFVVVAWSAVVQAAPPGPRGWMMAGMVSLWGLRLSGYLAWRNIGKDEDRRYQAMREKFGPRFSLLSLFIVFWLQGILMWVVSLPVQVTGGSVAPWNWLDIVGAIVWLVGLSFESIGDFQLARFKSDPDNQSEVMDRGLWRYTRHPNYFGDFLVWWGITLVAWAGRGPWWIVCGPIVMSVLLMRVSGVTLLEKDIEERRPGYREYVRRTSAFFPWPPKAK